MKSLTFIILLFCTSIYAQQIPSDWFGEDKYYRKKADLDKLQGYLSEILDLQERTVLESDRNSAQRSRSWQLSEQKTDLAISKSGLLGIAALKASSAIEITWAKKAKKVKSTRENESRSGIELDSNMSDREILSLVNPSLEILFKDLEGDKKVEKELEYREQILNFHRSLNTVAQIRSERFVPSAFQLDLNASVSSPLFGFSRLSADTRLRLNWKISKGKSRKKSSEKDQETVLKIVEDLETSISEIEKQPNYKLSKVAVGLGLSKKNLLSFSKLSGGVIGYLFFKKVKSSRASRQILTTMDDSYQWLEPSSSRFLFFKRPNFRKGLEKSMDLSRWFSKSFEKKNSHWYIKEFKTAFTASYSGLLGLLGTSETSVVELYFSREGK